MLAGANNKNNNNNKIKKIIVIKGHALLDCEYLANGADRAYFAITNKYKVAHGLSIGIITSNLGPF